MLRCAESPATLTPPHFAEFHTDGWASHYNANAPPPLLLIQNIPVKWLEWKCHTCCSHDIWHSLVTNMIRAAKVTGLPLRPNLLEHTNHCAPPPQFSLHLAVRIDSLSHWLIDWLIDCLLDSNPFGTRGGSLWLWRSFLSVIKIHKADFSRLTPSTFMFSQPASWKGCLLPALLVC